MKEIYLIGIQTSYLTEAIELSEMAGFKRIFLVDNLNNYSQKIVDGYKVLKFDQLLKINKRVFYCCCIHTPSFREKIVKSLPERIFRPVSLIHPTAVISKRAKISDKGVIVGAGVIIGAHTTVSDFAIINRGALIGHDIEISEFATIESGAILGGLSKIQKRAYVAMGAEILPKYRVGTDSVVAAGAVVKNHVRKNTMVAGVPAVVKKTGIEGYRGSG